MFKYFPSRVFPVFKQLTNFMVSAMMALLGSTYLALLASDTASPNGLKQGSGVNPITWWTLVTSKPCSRYHLRRGVANRTFSPFYTADQAAKGLSHDVVLLGVRLHEFTNIIATDINVFEDRAHFAPGQTLISHLAQYPLGTHDLDLIQ